jgi:hypothetical protein
MIPTALVALAMGPAQLVYWAVLGNGSYVGLDTASALVLAMFAVMTFAWVACNLPLLWRMPQAWRDRGVPAKDGQTDTDLWLWVLSAAVSVAIGFRFFGHYYMQLVPPVTLLAAGALARSSRKAARVTIAATVASAVLFSFAGYVMHPFGGEPQYEKVSAYLAANAHADDAILVWGSAPEIYWASGLRPATRFITTNQFLAGNYPGRTQTSVPASDVDPQLWSYFYADFEAHPPRYILDTSPAKVRGAEHSPMSEFPEFNRIVERDYRYVRSIDGIAVYEARHTSGQGVDR